VIIVAGVDDSTHGEAAARRAVVFATRNHAQLHVVHVLHLPASLMTAMATVPAPVDDVADAQRTAVWERIGPILDSWPEGDVIRADLEGYPPDTLVRYAHEVGADLLVVGSRGRGDLAALFLGSTSHRILHLAECDVLIARSEDAA
jgi:nucleotide-binding universal stress UspA family protein